MRKSPNPTPRQQEALDYIRHEYARTGLPPTIREICRHLGIQAQNAVVGFLQRLVEKGHLRRVERGGGVGKYLPVVNEGECPCCGRLK
jgi:SOS-response transcriptional repressor LexA